MRLRNKIHNKKVSSHPLGPDATFIFIDFFSFQSGSPLNRPKPLKMAKICSKKVIIPHFLVGRRPNTDRFHFLACAQGRCLVTGCTGVGRRPTPEPPAGARIFWRLAPKNYSITKLSLVTYY